MVVMAGLFIQSRAVTRLEEAQVRLPLTSATEFGPPLLPMKSQNFRDGRHFGEPLVQVTLFIGNGYELCREVTGHSKIDGYFELVLDLLLLGSLFLQPPCVIFLFARQCVSAYTCCSL